MRKKILMILLILAPLGLAYAQEDAEAESPFSFSTDLVSRYLWRGLLYSANPNIQPTIDFTKGNLSIGAWGSYGLSDKYAEVDLYIAYTAGNFTITLFDYYAQGEPVSQNNYFKWGKGTTPHSLEGTIAFNGTENFPISLTVATFFLGNDDWDTDGNIDYSTYFEIGYSKQMGSIGVSLFAGGTPAKGLYHTKAGIVNVGLGLSKEIAITDGFKLPVGASLVLNPSAKDIFLVFKVTL